jgi:hypothetical protein
MLAIDLCRATARLNNGALMTQEQITARLGEILAVLSDDPGHRGVLSSGERIAAAIALEHDDWIIEDGFATIAAARARIDAEWLVAAQLHKARLSSTALKPSIDAGTLAYDVSKGRWDIIGSHGQRVTYINAGDQLFLDIDGALRLTTIEFDEAEQRYYSVDGYPLADGEYAAMST